MQSDVTLNGFSVSFRACSNWVLKCRHWKIGFQCVSITTNTKNPVKETENVIHGSFYFFMTLFAVNHRHSCTLFNYIWFIKIGVNISFRVKALFWLHSSSCFTVKYFLYWAKCFWHIEQNIVFSYWARYFYLVLIMRLVSFLFLSSSAPSSDL